MKPTVNLCVFATGRYREFLVPMVRSAEQFFCADFDRTFHVWSESEFCRECEYPANVSHKTEYVWHYIEHEPWPNITLHRYRTFLDSAGNLLETGDFSFYADVDGKFLRHVGEDILSNLVAVQHAGFVETHFAMLPYERRPDSTAYVPRPMGYRYYGGGFQGGRTTTFLDVCKVLDDAIRVDEERGVMARAHDESHWNKYLAFHRPRRDCYANAPLDLPACYLDGEGHPYERPDTAKFLSLRKNNRLFHQ